MLSVNNARLAGTFDGHNKVPGQVSAGANWFAAAAGRVLYFSGAKDVTTLTGAPPWFSSASLPGGYVATGGVYVAPTTSFTLGKSFYPGAFPEFFFVASLETLGQTVPLQQLMGFTTLQLVDQAPPSIYGAPAVKQPEFHPPFASPRLGVGSGFIFDDETDVAQTERFVFCINSDGELGVFETILSGSAKFHSFETLRIASSIVEIDISSPISAGTTSFNLPFAAVKGIDGNLIILMRTNFLSQIDGDDPANYWQFLTVGPSHTNDFVFNTPVGDSILCVGGTAGDLPGASQSGVDMGGFTFGGDIGTTTDFIVATTFGGHLYQVQINGSKVAAAPPPAPGKPGVPRTAPGFFTWVPVGLTKASAFDISPDSGLRLSIDSSSDNLAGGFIPEHGLVSIIMGGKHINTIPGTEYIYVRVIARSGDVSCFRVSVLPDSNGNWNVATYTEITTSDGMADNWPYEWTYEPMPGYWLTSGYTNCLLAFGRPRTIRPVINVIPPRNDILLAYDEVDNTFVVPGVHWKTVLGP